MYAVEHGRGQRTIEHFITHDFIVCCDVSVLRDRQPTNHARRWSCGRSDGILELAQETFKFILIS